METEHVVFHHSSSIQIRFTDIDMMAHVTNSAHLAYCDIARMNYFNDVLGDKIEQTEESLVIASITVDFKSPIFLQENIKVLTKTSKIGNKSIHTYQHIVNADTGELKTVVRTAISGFNYIKQETIVVPERWKKKLHAFEKEVEFKY